jgi:multidrug transporter EmrE-like cation transporter
MGYVYIFLTIVFTVYGQIILKWRVSLYGQLPFEATEKLLYFLRILIDPFVITGLMSAFVAMLCWLAAMTKFDISYAYPFMSLSFALVFILSILFFKEPFTMQKVIGLIVIIIGIIISSKSL